MTKVSREKKVPFQIEFYVCRLSYEQSSRCCMISSLKLTRFYQRVKLTPDTILKLRRNDPELKDL